jgi:hypothetical protein
MNSERCQHRPCLSKAAAPHFSIAIRPTAPAASSKENENQTLRTEALYMIGSPLRERRGLHPPRPVLQGPKIPIEHQLSGDATRLKQVGRPTTDTNLGS